MVLKRPYHVDEDSSSKRVNRKKRSIQPNSVEDGIGKGGAVSGDLMKSVEHNEGRESLNGARPVLWSRGSYTQAQLPVRIGPDHQVDVPSWEEQQRRNALRQLEPDGRPSTSG